MKIGDLIKMKYIILWQKKVVYHEQPLIVLETHANAIKVLYPCGMIKSDLAEYYEVINESR
jgi:hypothetical protein